MLNIKTAPRTMNIAQFAKERGMITTQDVDSHIHAGLRSAPTTKSYARSNAAALSRLQAARDETVRLFREAVARGEIIDADSIADMERTARGMPENPSVQAAKRLLEKRRIKSLGGGDETH